MTRTAKNLRPRPAVDRGLHVATVELLQERTAQETSYRVRLLTGELIDASLGPGVEPALALECLRDRRSLLVHHDGQGTRILGALQTSASATRTTRAGDTELAGHEVDLCAERRVSIRAGSTTLSLDHAGNVRLNGQRLTLDLAALVRIVSASVELP